MPETLNYVYTTEAEIQRIWSPQGVLLRTDADEDGVSDDGVITDAVYDATDTVNLYCETWYSPNDMAENQWVRRNATWIAAHLISLLRGDPGYYHARYERCIEFLERVNEGKLQIPRLPFRFDMQPAMSNLRVDQRYTTKKIRVQPSTSVGGIGSRQDLDYWFTYET